MSNIDISTSRNYLYTLLAGFVLLFAVSCEDKNDDDEGHTDADGFVLETEDGVEAYKELKLFVSLNTIFSFKNKTIRIGMAFIIIVFIFTTNCK